MECLLNHGALDSLWNGTSSRSRGCPTGSFNSRHSHAANRLVTARSATDKSALGLSVGSAGSLIQATLHPSPSPPTGGAHKTRRHLFPLTTKQMNIAVLCHTRALHGALVESRVRFPALSWTLVVFLNRFLEAQVVTTKHRLTDCAKLQAITAVTAVFLWGSAARRKVHQTTGRHFTMTKQTPGYSCMFILPGCTALRPKTHDSSHWEPQTSVCLLTAERNQPAATKLFEWTNTSNPAANVLTKSS